MLLILDTDLLTILQEETQPACDRLRARLKPHAPDEVRTTIIGFQERMQGWLAVLHQARSGSRILLAYEKLDALLKSFCKMLILPFDGAAQNQFSELRKQKVRIGTMDLRIAAIALEQNATLLNRNLRDYRQVPALVVEDWTR